MYVNLRRHTSNEMRVLFCFMAKSLIAVYHVTEEGWTKLGVYDVLDLHHQYKDQQQVDNETAMTVE